MFRLRVLGAAGITLRICEKSESRSVPVKGGNPVSISCNTAPSEKMSARPSAGSPRRRSGEMYQGEPNTVPAIVRVPLGSDAMPKSVIFTTPLSSTMMLAGLMSR